MRTPHLSWVFLGALALGFAVPGHASPAALACQSGPAFGDWDLPVSSSASGFMSGKLVDASINQGVYAIEAKLIDVPSPCLSCITGKIKGSLDDGIGWGPDFIVEGSYSGFFLNGQGTFVAYIYDPLGPSTQPVGKIAGKFSDPPFSPTGIGTFKAEWEICP